MCRPPTLYVSLVLGIVISSSAWAQEKRIQHDSEHYVLLHQYADQWAAEDRELDQKLAEIRQKNGGKRPNIVYILLDDMGFGEYGIPALNKIRGGRTPNIDRIARQGATFTRMYAENICTPTRAAFMTGRYAVRTGMEVTKVTPPEGGGLNGKDVTIAELLSRNCRARLLPDPTKVNQLPRRLSKTQLGPLFAQLRALDLGNTKQLVH